MANYTCVARTNYFRVTDEGKYQELFKKLVSDDDIVDFTKTSEDGIILHGFGSYGSIDFMTDADEYNFDEFIKKLQSILPEDEAFMFFEAGHEKLRYVCGYCVVVTNKEVRSLSIDDYALTVAKQLLGDDFTTKIDY